MVGGFIEEDVDGRGLGSAFEIEDPVDDPVPDGDRVLDGVVVVVLGHCLVVLIVLLMDEHNGDSVGGVEIRSDGDASIVFTEDDILDGAYCCSLGASCLLIFI